MDTDNYTYDINAKDQIMRVSSNWDDFATKNNGAPNTLSNQLIGKSIWNFIHGKELQHLYESLFDKARQGTPLNPIPFRCDAPSERRHLQLTLTLIHKGILHIESKIEKKEPRPTIKLLDSAITERNNEILHVCSVCKKMLFKQRWVELEEGFKMLKLFKRQYMPSISHGLCPSCYASMARECAQKVQTKASSTCFPD